MLDFPGTSSLSLLCGPSWGEPVLVGHHPSPSVSSSFRMSNQCSLQCQPKLAPVPLCAHFLGKGREKKQNIYYKVRNIFIILGISFA